MDSKRGDILGLDLRPTQSPRCLWHGYWAMVAIDFEFSKFTNRYLPGLRSWACDRQATMARCQILLPCHGRFRGFPLLVLAEDWCIACTKALFLFAECDCD
jgi:hypothetical protein